MFKWSPVWPEAAHQSQSTSLLCGKMFQAHFVLSPGDPEISLYSKSPSCSGWRMGFRSPSARWARSGLRGCRRLQAQWGPREQTKVPTPTHNVHPRSHCYACPPTAREQHLWKTMSSHLCAQFHTTGFMLIFSFCRDNPILTARALASTIFDVFVYWLSPHSSQTLLHTGALSPPPCQVAPLWGYPPVNLSANALFLK